MSGRGVLDNRFSYRTQAQVQARVQQLLADLCQVGLQEAAGLPKSRLWTAAYLMTLAQREADFLPWADNPKSTARGLFQFLKGTADGLGAQGLMALTLKNYKKKDGSWALMDRNFEWEVFRRLNEVDTELYLSTWKQVNRDVDGSSGYQGLSGYRSLLDTSEQLRMMTEERLAVDYDDTEDGGGDAMAYLYQGWLDRIVLAQIWAELKYCRQFISKDMDMVSAHMGHTGGPAVAIYNHTGRLPANEKNKARVLELHKQYLEGMNGRAKLSYAWRGRLLASDYGHATLAAGKPLAARIA